MSVDSDLETLTRSVGLVIRAERAARGMSLGDLARASGLSKTILSRIEAGEGNPSVETLWRVSQAFDLPLGALLRSDAPPAARRVAARSGRRLGADSGMAAWLVHAEGVPSRCELYELALPQGVTHPGRPHLPGTNEVIVCTKGRLRTGPDGEEVELGSGDAAWFASDVPHRYTALRDARALCLMLYPDR
jgi:XRE family transcriptional regulator, regulator of sulfur utilization